MEKQYLHHNAVVERLKEDEDGYKGDSTVQGTQELLDKCQVSLASWLKGQEETDSSCPSSI